MIALLALLSFVQDGRQPVIPAAQERTQRVLDVTDILDADALRTEGESIALGDGAPGRSREVSVSRVTTDQGTRLVLREHRLEGPAADLDELIHTWMRPGIAAGTDMTVLRRGERVVAGLGGERDSVFVASDGTLVAHVSADRHAWLDQFLAAQREISDLVSLKFTFVTSDEKAFDTLFRDSAVAMLAKADADAALEQLKRDTAANILQSPKVLVFPRQRAQISTVEELAYIKDWKVVLVEPGSTAIADPQIDVVRDGFDIDARAVFVDPEHVGVEVSIAHSQVNRPIATKKITLGLPGMSEVEVGVPDVTRVSLESRLLIGVDHCALFRAPFTEAGKSAVVFLRARRTPLPTPAVQVPRNR